MTDQQPPWGAPQSPQPPQPPPPQQWNQPSTPPPPGWSPPPATGWGAPPSPTTLYGSSVWAIVAGVALLLWGLLWTLGGIVAVGFGNLANNIPGMPVGFDAGGLFAVIGIVILVIGILHLVAAIFIWAHRDWARYLGLVLAVLGTLLGLLSLPAALSPSSGQGGDSIGGTLLLLVPYAVALIGLILGGAHFRRGYV